MKQDKSTFCVILATVTVVLFLAMLSCTGQEEQQITLLDQYYKIVPTTLIDSLKNGDMNAFIPTEEDLDLLPRDQELPLNWLQADYFHIATSLYEGVLGKSLQGWELTDMSFHINCSGIGNGFQNGRLEFFKVVREKKQEVRMSSFIDIDPRANFVRVKEEKYYPKLVNWKAIDMAHLKISADAALQIVESHGGQETRQSVNNACNIFVGLFPNASHYRGWEVMYSSEDGMEIFSSIQIDPYTGEIK